tara:strand:- start:430 stop:558 length:129 start_codon:yes stop_codon:yes gene_type:complete
VEQAPAGRIAGTLLILLFVVAVLELLGVAEDYLLQIDKEVYN